MIWCHKSLVMGLGNTEGYEAHDQDESYQSREHYGFHPVSFSSPRMAATGTQKKQTTAAGTMSRIARMISGLGGNCEITGFMAHPFKELTAV